jgi:tRNA (guanosine-2'-O-)-methyltransferase
MAKPRIARLEQALDRRQPDLTVLLENVHKPHNLAAILRSCDAAGVLEAHSTAPEPDEVELRVGSAGAAKWVPLRFHADSVGAIATLQQRGFRVLAAHLDGDSRDFRSVDLTLPTAFLLGQEKFGVTPAALARVDGKVSIPMVGLVGSLNVSVASALLLFEAQRQRQAAGLYDRPRLSPGERRAALFEWVYPEVAAYCARRGLPYPRLDEAGELLDPVPRRP